MPCIWQRWPRPFRRPERRQKKNCVLLLNCFYMISEKKTDLKVIKAVFELRTMSECGFLPQLVYCRDCGTYDGPAFYLDPAEGCLLCEACAQKAGKKCNLDAGALFALRHICLVEDKKIFGFRISVGSLAKLCGRIRTVCSDASGQAFEELRLSEICSVVKNQKIDLV